MLYGEKTMEVELKFLIEDKLAQERILKDRHLAEIKDEGSEEEIELKATYLDTEDMDLCKRKMAFRVRLENGSPIATLKWGGEATDGLHVRGELNVPVDESYMRYPRQADGKRPDCNPLLRCQRKPDQRRVLECQRFLLRNRGYHQPGRPCLW